MTHEISLFFMDMIFKKILYLLSLILWINPYSGQSLNPSPTSLPITESAIKQLFKFAEKTEMELSWNACYDTDSTYDSSDTITLYNDPYYYLSAHCCFITTWYFNPNTSTFNIHKTHVCEEPPPTTIDFEHAGLRLHSFEQEGSCFIAIYQKKLLKESFKVISLHPHVMKNGDDGLALTLYRTYPNQ